jgi:hypothetical protein
VFVNIRTGSYKDVSLPLAEPAAEPVSEVKPHEEATAVPQAEPGYAAYQEVVLFPEESPAPEPTEEPTAAPGSPSESAPDEEE